MTVQEIHTEFESASILFTSGSTQFGNSTDDVHNVTGSMKITGSFQVDNGTLTAGTVDINGGTIDGITSLTAGGDLDIGSHDFRAATLTADGLTSGRVPFAGTAGLLSDDSDLTFATATLSATNLTTTGTIKNMALVSGSSVSTGSFGHITLSEGLEIGGVFKASLSNNDAGTSNTIFGKNAGASIDAGTNQNVAIGENTFDASTNDAVGNVIVGYQAGSDVTTGDKNTAIGFETGNAITSGDNNTFVGALAGDAINTANDNTAIGYGSLTTAQTASGSVAIGLDAGGTITTGNRNIAIGYDALNGAATTGDNNVAIGVSAGDALTSGKNNVAIGKDAFTRAAAANEIIAIGNNAAGQNTVTTGADGTVAIGFFGFRRFE